MATRRCGHYRRRCRAHWLSNSGTVNNVRNAGWQDAVGGMSCRSERYLRYFLKLLPELPILLTWVLRLLGLMEMHLPPVIPNASWPAAWMVQARLHLQFCKLQQQFFFPLLIMDLDELRGFLYPMPTCSLDALIKRLRRSLHIIVWR